MAEPALANQLQMSSREFTRIREIAYNFCGVDLDGKQVLVSSRLGKKVRDMQLPSFASYCDHVEQDHSGNLFTDMIDALTTNHTSFFREARHFDFLQNSIVPYLADNSTINVWSAACSSGEEPYTIAFSMIEALGESAYSRMAITATDISTRVLEKARRGMYPLASVSAMSAELRRECLMKGVGQYAGQCMVKPRVRHLVAFQQLNLLQDCSHVGPFDVVFCRNVMIYFDQPTQQTVVNNLVSRLAPGGYLLIGHAESLNGIKHPLEYSCTATYRKPGGDTQGISGQSRKHRVGPR